MIIPLLKENKMDLILQKSTEMGVNKIIVFPFKRCVVKADKKKIKSKIERWMRILKEDSDNNIGNTQFKTYKSFDSSRIHQNLHGEKSRYVRI